MSTSMASCAAADRGDVRGGVWQVGVAGGYPVGESS